MAGVVRRRELRDGRGVSRRPEDRARRLGEAGGPVAQGGERRRLRFLRVRAGRRRRRSGREGRSAPGPPRLLLREVPGARALGVPGGVPAAVLRRQPLSSVGSAPPGRASGTRSFSRSFWRPAGERRSPCASLSGGRRWTGSGWPRSTPGSGTASASGAPAATRPSPRRSWVGRSGSRCRRIGSRPSTSRTPRAPTAWHPWSSSRTAAPGSRSTASSTSRRRTSSSPTTSAPCPRPSSDATGGSRNRTARGRTSCSSTAGAASSRRRSRRSTALGVELPAAGLAKREEEIWVPDRPDPIRLSRKDPALQLIQRARDEAHRFAISRHRRRRGKRHAANQSDGDPGRRAGAGAPPAEALRLRPGAESAAADPARRSPAAVGPGREPAHGRVKRREQA